MFSDVMDFLFIFLINAKPFSLKLNETNVYEIVGRLKECNFEIEEDCAFPIVFVF